MSPMMPQPFPPFSMGQDGRGLPPVATGVAPPFSMGEGGRGLPPGMPPQGMAMSQIRDRMQDMRANGATPQQIQDARREFMDQRRGERGGANANPGTGAPGMPPTFPPFTGLGSPMSPPTFPPFPGADQAMTTGAYFGPLGQAAMQLQSQGLQATQPYQMATPFPSPEEQALRSYGQFQPYQGQPAPAMGSPYAPDFAQQQPVATPYQQQPAPQQPSLAQPMQQAPQPMQNTMSGIGSLFAQGQQAMQQGAQQQGGQRPQQGPGGQQPAASTAGNRPAGGGGVL